MIGREADDAIERKKELRKVGLALLAALFLHLVVGCLIAASHGWFSSSETNYEEEKPVELTFVDMSTPVPAAPKNPMFMETDPMKASAKPPEGKTFESNADQVAASEKPATGNIPLPSQDGMDRPNVDLDTHDYSLAMQGAQAQPKPQPQETPKETAAPTVEPTITPLPDQLAMLRPTATPRPTAQPTPQPQRPSSAYQAQKQKTKLSGNITNRGASSVNAVGTPLGRYQKQLYDAVGSRWYYYIQQRIDSVNIGTARVSFSVDRSGKVRNLKVVQNTSNETFANVCIQSVIDIKLPPIPEDVASSLPPEGLDTDLTFTMFPNQQ